MKRVSAIVLSVVLVLAAMFSAGCDKEPAKSAFEDYIELSREELVEAGVACPELPQGAEPTGYYLNESDGSCIICFEYNGSSCTYMITSYADFEFELPDGYELGEELKVSELDAKFGTHEDGSCALVWLDFVPGLLCTLVIDDGVDVSSAAELAGFLYAPVQGESDSELSAAELDYISMSGFIAALVCDMYANEQKQYSAAGCNQGSVERFLSYYAANGDYGYETLPAEEVGLSGELAKDYVNFSQDEVAQFVDIAFGDNFSVADFADNSELLIYNASSYWIGIADAPTVSVDYTGASGEPGAEGTECYYSYTINVDETVLSGTLEVVFAESDGNMYYMTIDSIAM